MTTPPSAPNQSPGGQCENTDRHLWPQVSAPDAPYEALFVTREGGIGINIQGNVIVRPLREWHRLAGGTPGPLGEPPPSAPDLVARLRMLVEGEAPDLSGRGYLIEVLREAAAEIERLQKLALEDALTIELSENRAREIERLTRENEEMRRTFGSHPLFEEKDRQIDRLRAEVGGMAKAVDAADIENERLRAALERIESDTWLCGRCCDIAREALRGAGEK